MNKFLLLFIAVQLPIANAVVVNTLCRFPEQQMQAEISVNAEFQPIAGNYERVVTSKLVVNGKDVPAVRQTCFPRKKGFLCVHQGDKARYDVYPKIDVSTHQITPLFIIVTSQKGQMVTYKSECK